MMKGFINTRILFIMIVILAALFVYGSYQYAVSSAYRVSSEKAKEMIQKNNIDVVLDVRTDMERATLGYYPGSIHVPSADLETRMADYPNKDTRIIVYCNTGHRARMATDTLQQMGYHNARYISSTYASLM
jgi:rhodanese-related sulfurtransferase